MMLSALWHIAFGPCPSPRNLPAYLIWTLFGNAARFISVAFLIVSSSVMLCLIPLAVLALVLLAAPCSSLSVDPSKIIPASRADVTGPLSWLAWALWGNDEDGIAGERGGVATFDGLPVTWRQVIRWNIRNPLHNLTHHVIAVPCKTQRVIWGTPRSDGALWPAGSVLLAINGLPCLSIQTARIEAYAGWRPRVVAGVQMGVFGLALRKVKATS